MIRRPPHRVENRFERRNARICMVVRWLEPGAVKFDLPSCDVFRARLVAEIETAMTPKAGDALAKEQNLATLERIREG